MFKYRKLLNSHDLLNSLDSGPRNTIVEDYEYYGNLRKAMRQGEKEWLGGLSDREQRNVLKELYEAVEYTELAFGEFYEEFPKWKELNCWAKIPKLYFEYIGVSEDDIEHLTSLDREVFRSRLNRELYPQSFIMRLMSSVYQYKRFPEGTTEEDAIQLVLNIIDELKEDGLSLRCCITYTGLKSIYLEPDGSHHTTFYPPRLIDKGSYYEVPDNGYWVGGWPPQ